MPESNSKKPKLVPPDAVEDVQSVGTVSQMYTKFVRKIDAFRSIANAPGLGVNTSQVRGASAQERFGRRALTGLDVDPNRFVESRAHAFYRMIGIPVTSPDGKYYNPGHDPLQSETLDHRTSVNDTLNLYGTSIIQLSQLREVDFKNRRNVFANQNDVSIVYATIMRNTKRFLMAVPSDDPFSFDLQTQPVAGREIEVILIKGNYALASLSADSLPIPLFIYKNVSHILKPFIVIPEIETAVTPETLRVCVPFLPDKESTKISTEHTLKRPVLEYIIKQRLKSTEVDTVFLKAAETLLQNKAAATADPAGIKTTLLALSGQDTIVALDSGIINVIQGFTSVQTSTVDMLTKAIRVAILELDQSIRDFDKVRISHDIQVLPSTEGPEFGGTIITVGGVNKASKQQQSIALMKLTELVASRQSQLEEEFVGDESVYATTVVADTAKDFTPSVTKLERERDEYGRQAIQNLKIMEIVTGEVSGLGLVDILAIYTALWAIDIEYLIGLLDDSALHRLDDTFPELINDEVQKQLNGTRPGIFKTLQEFEKLLFNILTYADKVLVQTRQSPRLARKGSIT